MNYSKEQNPKSTSSTEEMVTLGDYTNKSPIVQHREILKIQEITRQSIIAAMYVILTWMIKDLSYGPLQLRISEIMVLMVFYNKKHKIGLLIGCFIANMFSPLGIIDMAMGTFASFLAFTAMSRCKNIVIASLMPGIFSFIIPLMLFFVREIPASAILIIYLQILASEVIIVGMVGIPVFKALEKYQFFKQYIQ